ncbi:hypothetical protein B566_EDAN006641 [Ephemera danica]|nr:hypothetical protein B566_EDAN006641 [Ephemera danica]
MGKSLINIADAHYFGLPSQGNVYCLTNLCMRDGGNKILVASLKRKVFSFEYIESGGVLKPTVREVPFTYIPSGAEIISIDAFNKSPISNDFVIGITIIKGATGDPRVGGETYLNIYSEWEPSTEFNLDSVAQSCLSLELQFTPYQLYHTTLPTAEVVCLLSGSDDRIHMYREDRTNHCYNETDIVDWFPELCGLHSVALWLDLCYTPSADRRLSAVGCENGALYLKVVKVDTLDIIFSQEKCYDGPITSVKFFGLEGCDSSDHLSLWKQKGISKTEELHLLVASGLQPAAVYMNVLKDGLQNFHGLPGSGLYDTVLCSSLADINMDGKLELLLGTYGQEVLIYKYDGSMWLSHGQVGLANPVFSLAYLDVTGDGVCELVALTLKGVHILQHNLEDIKRELMKRMEKIDPSKQSSELEVSSFLTSPWRLHRCTAVDTITLPAGVSHARVEEVTEESP